MLTPALDDADMNYDETHFRGLFEHSPVSLWEEDYTDVKRMLDDLRASGVADLRLYLTEHPEFADQCMARIKVLDVNRQTLIMFEAESKGQLLANLDRVFRDEVRTHYTEELISMWAGNLSFEGEGINYTLTGKPLHIHLRWSVLPGCEAAWERVLVSIDDITESRRARQALAASEAYARGLFEHSPVSLWEEDYSEVKRALDALRAQGVRDLAAYLREHPAFVDECMARIRVVDVNAYTLELFEARSKDELLHNLPRVFRDEMRAHFASELLGMWAGQTLHESEGVNYSLTGRPIDIYLRWSVLPGYEQTWGRALVSIVDMTERKRAQAAQAASEAYARGLFEHSPISLWVEDYSGVKKYLDRLRAEGVTDLSFYLSEHPEAATECMALIRVLDVNQQTLALFRAKSKEDLLANLHLVFRDEMRRHFVDELTQMWAGRTSFEGEGINYALNGDPLDIYLRWTVLPGYEQTWGRALVSIIDVTARKKAEAYLKYLGTHDVLTGLYNRAFYEEELHRLERGRQFPISIIIADLNGLKPANDQFGHEAGDALLRRAAEALKASFRSEDIVARIGGDEFAVLLPGTDSAGAAQAIQRVHRMIQINNTYYRGPQLSLSLGAASGEQGAQLADIQRLADDRMYEEKRRHHRVHPPVARTGNA